MNYSAESSDLYFGALVGQYEIWTVYADSTDIYPVVDCYYTEGSLKDIYGISLTNDDFKNKSNFAGFDFKNYWRIPLSEGMPVLWFEDTNTTDCDIKIKAGKTYSAAEDYKTIKLSFSDNEKVATIVNGEITGINPGEAEIRVLLIDGKELRYNVRVEFSFLNWIKNIFDFIIQVWRDIYNKNQ